MEAAAPLPREHTKFSISSDAMGQGMYRSLRVSAGLVSRSQRGLISIGGADRAEYLQGQLTNDIAALEDGQGCYSAHLTPHGRMIADMDVFCVDDRLLLDVDVGVLELLVRRFDDLIFTEDVTVSDLTEHWTSFGVSGPAADSVVTTTLERLGSSGLSSERASGPYTVARVAMGQASLVVARTDFLGTPGFSVWVERHGAEALRAALVDTGVIEVDERVADVVRIENGHPTFPADLGADIIPLEAGIEDRAISSTKGCYVGQEVIIRILHRGQGRVARRLTGLRLDRNGSDPGAGPAVGAKLWDGEKEVGRLTSVAMSTEIASPIALGYVAKDHLEPGTILEADVSSGRVKAVVTKLPFLP